MSLAPLAPFLDFARNDNQPSRNELNLRQIIRQHVAPVIPIMAAPFAVIEPVLNALRIQNLRQPIRFVAGVVPFAGADDDAHVAVFPRIGRVRQIFVRTIEINVVVVIAVEEIADIERPAQTDEVTYGIGMPERDISGVISAEARSANRDSTSMALASRQIEYVVYDHIFVSVMGFHPIGRMNFFVVKTFEIDRVRAIDGDFAVVDVPGNRIDQTEILGLVIASKRCRKQNQRQPAAVSKGEHFELATEPGRVPFDVALVHRKIDNKENGRLRSIALPENRNSAAPRGGQDRHLQRSVSVSCPNTHSPEQSGGTADFHRKSSVIVATFWFICHAATRVFRENVTPSYICRTDRTCSTPPLRLPGSNGASMKLHSV